MNSVDEIILFIDSNSTIAKSKNVWFIDNQIICINPQPHDNRYIIVTCLSETMFDEAIVVIDDAAEKRQADVNFQCPIANLSSKVQPNWKQKLATCTNIDSHKISRETRCNRSSCSENDPKTLAPVTEGISEDDSCICRRVWSRASDADTSVTEDIELESLVHTSDLDLQLIEDDVIESPCNCGASLSRVSGDDSSEERSAFCYTPERLVRSLEYRILTPSPKYFFDRAMENGPPFRDSSPKTPRFRRQLEVLIDSSQIGN